MKWNLISTDTLGNQNWVFIYIRNSESNAHF